jgi:hypothetical protein
MIKIYALKFIAVALLFTAMKMKAEPDIQVLLMAGAYALVSVALYVAIHKLKRANVS